MKCFVLTNNPMAQDVIASSVQVTYKPGSIKQVYEQAASYVGDGYRLLTHPLSGSVKPGETPYKSMLFDARPQMSMDAVSARLIASALDTCDKFVDVTEEYDFEILRDLQVVDLSLIEGALESARQ